MKRIPWRALTMVGALLVIWVVFSAMTSGTFLVPRNLSLLARQMSVTGILAIGMVLVIVAGQIDLSVGALAGLLGGFSAIAFVNKGWPLAASFALALVLGGVLGAAQGWLTAKLGIPPFIVTLGGMLLFQGILLGVTGGVSISPTPSFLYVGQAYVPPRLGWVFAGVVAAAFLFRSVRASGGDRWRWLGLAALVLGFTAAMNAYEGIPVPVLLLVVLATTFSVLAQHTPFGRHLYAIGGNRATSDAGRTMELDAIAAAVIGGTSLLGGQGTVWGALLGALVMASLDNGMSLLNTESFWQPIIKGTILVAAVAVDMAGRRRS